MLNAPRYSTCATAGPSTTNPGGASSATWTSKSYAWKPEREVRCSAMPNFPPISVRQPRPFDIVDNPVDVCGVGTGFEGVFNARVRDANGNEIASATIHAGGTGVWGNYHVSMSISGIPPTTTGTLEV